MKILIKLMVDCDVNKRGVVVIFVFNVFFVGLCRNFLVSLSLILCKLR